MKRPGGRVDVYWVARPDAVRAGYRPKSVALKADPGAATAPPDIAARCRVMWAEMLEFLAGRTSPGRATAAGTIGWLVDLYETDEDSPFRRLRSSSRQSYGRGLDIVKATVGERRIDAVTASDVRRWFKSWARADGEGALKNHRRAYGCVQMLRVVVKYGAGQRLPHCRELSQILTETEFPVPRPRASAITPAQIAAFLPKAHEMGSASLARAVALQFCTSLRQKDVIGEWTPAPEGGARWSGGLRWGEHIKADWTLEKPTSKSNFKKTVRFDLTLMPLALAELQRVPATSRIGPVILDERTGKPWRQREFARRFREIARAAGIPDDVYNMDTRAGALTHGRNQGADLADLMKTGGHTQLQTNLGYQRGDLEATSRVARLRFGARNKAGTDPE